MRKNWQFTVILLLAITSVYAIPRVEVNLRTRSNEIPNSPVIGDLNSDGHPEIVITSRSETISSSSGDGWIAVVDKFHDDTVDTLWSDRFGRGVFTPAIADLDRDGIGEIYCCVYFDSPGEMGVMSVNGNTGSVNWIYNGGGAFYSNAGHEVLLADFDGDGQVEVIAQQNRSGTNYEIVVLDGLTGALELIIDTGSKRSYASMDCEDINLDGNYELLASITAGSSGDVEVVCWDNTGTELWRVPGGPIAVADIDLDNDPEVICEWVDGSYNAHIFIYDGYGVLESEVISIDAVSTVYSHYECPVIADFDLATPEPEIAFAVNHSPSSSQCIITVVRVDGTIFWQTDPFTSGEIISMSAADLSCDGVWDLCSYNMAGEFIVFDGRTGYFWATFDDFDGDYRPDPNRFVPIADLDNDCHAEFAVSTYRGGYSSTNRGIYIYGDDDDWNPVRRMWNTGSYYYTNIDDDMHMLSDTSAQLHWEVDNIWRAQRVIPCGLEAIPGPELLANPIQCAKCDSIGEFIFSAKIWNPTCEEIAYYTHCILEFDSIGSNCLDYIEGQCTTYIGDLMPETDTVLIWRFEVDPSCDSCDISFWLHATCLNSLIVSNRHIPIQSWTPRCHYPPAVVRIRPNECGNVISCGPMDSLGSVINTGQELIFNISADSIYGTSYPLLDTLIMLTVQSNSTPLETITLDDPRLYWDGDEYHGGLFYNPNPLYPHGDTVVFKLETIYNELFCMTTPSVCTIIVDDMYPDTIDVHPDHMDYASYDVLDEVYAVLADDFMSIDSTTVLAENMSVEVNGVPINDYNVDIHCDGVDPDTVYFDIYDGVLPADTIEICMWGMEDTPDDTSFCGPNVNPTTCWKFFILAHEPVAYLKHPERDTYSACLDQEIIIHIVSEVSMDSISFELEIDSITYSIDEEYLWWDSDSNDLHWTPEPGWWQSGNMANVCLNRAESRIGQNIANAPFCFNFWLDFDAPEIEFLTPQMGLSQMIRDVAPRITASLDEPLSGLNTDSVRLWINGDEIQFPPAILNNEGDGMWTVIFDPAFAGIEFNTSDTIEVSLKACDSPDYCDANCYTLTDSFIIEPLIACLVIPNPFTPNSDNINEVTVFDFPHMFTQSGELTIFDIRNRPVFSKTIDPIDDARNFDARSWDGKDTKGKLLPEGLYLYVIKQDGKVICNGSVVLAR
ncbi:gliding motility-associated C-terminal domain-containing protein [bacterium]|nr:gliding motility-associated C-terminal domain-containing protein [bacterium]